MFICHISKCKPTPSRLQSAQLRSDSTPYRLAQNYVRSGRIIVGVYSPSWIPCNILLTRIIYRMKPRPNLIIIQEPLYFQFGTPLGVPKSFRGEIKNEPSCLQRPRIICLISFIYTSLYLSIVHRQSLYFSLYPLKLLSCFCLNK